MQEEHFWAVATALAIGQGLGQLKTKGVPGIVLEAEAKHVRGVTVRNKLEILPGSWYLQKVTSQLKNVALNVTKEATE